MNHLIQISYFTIKKRLNRVDISFGGFHIVKSFHIVREITYTLEGFRRLWRLMKMAYMDAASYATEDNKYVSIVFFDAFLFY